MKKLLVMVPCREHHKKWILDAVDGRMDVVFSDDSREVADASVIIGEPELSDVQKAANLEWIQMTWAGTDRYTAVPGFPKDVMLSNLRGIFGRIMSEYAVGALLALCRLFPAYFENKKEALWEDAGSEMTLENKRILILGTGDTGGTTARRLKAFDTYNIGIRQNAGNRPDGFDEVHPLSELDSILPTADAVIGCLPSNNTAGILDEKRLRMLKPGAALVNMGRGNLIDCLALANVLEEGRLLGAALDVTDPEPLPADHPLWRQKNVILTPHVAGPSFEHCPNTEDRIIRFCCSNLQRCLNGDTPENLVKF